MDQDRILSFIRQSFQGFGWTVLISLCLAIVSFLIILLLREPIAADGVCRRTALTYSLNFIAPVRLGVKTWEIGDYAHYRHRYRSSRTDDRFDREVSFHIMAALEKSGYHGYWMRKTGFEPDRNIPTDIYRYVTVQDLRITPRNPKYLFTRNYFPILHESCEQGTSPLAILTKLGEVEIETEAGRFECIHYKAKLGPVHNHKVLEIWALPTVAPLGIVRARTETETLDLIAYGHNPNTGVPSLFQPVIDGISTLESGCNSCHGESCHEMFFPPK